MAASLKHAKDAAADGVSQVDISDKFTEFAKSAKPKSGGETIDVETTNKWLKMAGVDNKISTQDAASMFEMLNTKAMDQTEFLKSLTEICAGKRLNLMEILGKLAEAKLS